eukprot:scaffold155185_cov20-Prasinocladus_malaysianus.AAC.1
MFHRPSALLSACLACGLMQVSDAGDVVFYLMTAIVRVAQENLEESLKQLCWLDGTTAKARFRKSIGGNLADFLDFPTPDMLEQAVRMEAQ